jgi:hypothetical protein
MLLNLPLSIQLVGLSHMRTGTSLFRVQLLSSENSFSIFEGYSTFYPGDNITFTFESGTVLTESWLTIYNDPDDTGPLLTGGDFYNFFVLGLFPHS